LSSSLKVTLIRCQIIDYNGNTPLHDAVKTFNTDGIVKLFGYKYDYGEDDDSDVDDDVNDNDDMVMVMMRMMMIVMLMM